MNSPVFTSPLEALLAELKEAQKQTAKARSLSQAWAKPGRSFWR